MLFVVFLLFYGNLTILLHWYLNFPGVFFIFGTSCCSQIYRFEKLVIKVVFLLYLGFIWVCWTALATILAFFAPYLLNFCYHRSAIFARAPSLASLRFLCVSIDNFKHVLCVVLLLPSLNGQEKCTWLGPFE